jgi:uncharacterized protein (DUF362 family)
LAESISRRAFLAAMPAAVAFASACRRRPYRLEDFTVASRSTVGLYPAADYAVDFGDVIYRGLEDLGVTSRLRGRRVFLKPNMVEYEAGTAINTNAAVVVGAAAAFLKAGASEVVVGEGPGHRRDTEYLLLSTGLYDQLRELRVRFVDLNHDAVRRVPLRSHFTGLAEMALPVEVLKSDVVVSMPKLKTHHWAGLTASMKNFFGVVPGAVYGWPKNILHVKGIDGSILDLNATVKPQLTIVDAVTAMEGDGPIMGKPRHMGALVMSTDLAAADATCARLIGIDPNELPYLAGAGEYLGNIRESRIDYRGERPDRYRTVFDRVKPQGIGRA